MDLIDQLTDTELEKLVKQIMGENWAVSPHTEIYAQNEPFKFYQEWNLHLDKYENKMVADHIHKKFTLFYLLEGSLEMQLVIILNVIKENYLLRKTVAEYN